MKQYVTFWLLALTFLLAGCATETSYNTASNTDENSNAAAAPAGEMASALEAAENKAYEAWKNKDAKFFETFLTENYTGVGPAGRVGRDDSVNQMADNPCEVKSVTISDGNAVELDENTALFTSKNESDFTCGGAQGPSASYAATIYVKDGDKWSAAYHQNVVAADSKIPAPAPPPSDGTAKTEESDTGEDTKALSDLEMKLWDAFAKKDTKPFEEHLSDKFVHMTMNGKQDKAATIKGIGESTCEVKSHKLESFKSTKIGDGLLLTYKATQEGKCGDEDLPANAWAASYWVKEGDSWKAVYHMETAVPAASEKKEESAAGDESDA